MPVDPFSLVASGLGVLGSGVGAIVSAAQMPAKKRKYIREARRDALHNMRRDYAASMGFPVGADGAYQADKIQRTADDQFQVDPLSFVPFLQAGSQLASDIYQAGQPDPDEPDQKYVNKNAQYRTPPPPGGYKPDPADELERQQANAAAAAAGYTPFVTPKRKGY